MTHLPDKNQKRQSKLQHHKADRFELDREVSYDIMSPTKLWGGRFSEMTDQAVEAFTTSVHFDHRLYRHDILASIAHAKTLAQAGVLTEEECQTLCQGLEKICHSIECGDFAWDSKLEDVHMNIESNLTDQLGNLGKKLHTGRSRNDQVATDIRLWLRDELDLVVELIKQLQLALLSRAEQEVNTIMPGFTHLQIAQPVTLGHHLMAWFAMLKRDRERLMDCRKRINVMPLGSAALAGTTYSLNRHLTAEWLGFSRPSENSLDAVSDRDFAIEFVHCAALIMMHLSRFSEELILWISPPFGFIDLPDRFCTGSSIMPQKKNPDVAELSRGKTSRVYGHLIALLTLMKSQPLAYNRDNQEDKEPLFDTVDTVKATLHLFAGLISALEPKRERMRMLAKQGFATATDLADYLVKKGIPFRQAHDIVGQAVGYGIEQKKDLSEMSLGELQLFSSQIEEDVFQILTLEGSVQARDHYGGTAPNQVQMAIQQGYREISQ